MNTSLTARKASAAVVLAVLTLTACGGNDPVPGDPDYAAPAASTPTAAADTPTPAATDSPAHDPGPDADPVFAVQKLVAELGVANSGLLDPALDYREEMLAPARAVLTPEALSRYEQTLPPEGEPGETSTDAGSAWQLVAHTACLAGEAYCSADEPVAGPLSVTETERVEYEDGTVGVSFTAETVWAYTRISDGARQVADVKRDYVPRLVPGASTDGPTWLVDDWDGTVTTVGDARDAT
jgi:hypothetical protein